MKSTLPIASHGSDELAHHAANLAAIAFPIGAWFLHVEPYLAALVTVAGLAWYAVLFYDRFFKKK